MPSQKLRIQTATRFSKSGLLLHNLFFVIFVAALYGSVGVGLRSFVFVFFFPNFERTYFLNGP